MFVLDDPAPPRYPKIWKLKPTRQDLSYDIRHSYLLRTLDLCTRWPRPTSRMGSKTWILKRTRQELSFNIRHAYLIIALYLCTWWPPRVPKIWNVTPTRQDISFDIRHAYLIITLNFALDDPAHPRAQNYEIWNLIIKTYNFIVITSHMWSRGYGVPAPPGGIGNPNPGFSTTFLPDLIKYQIIYFLNIIN